MYGQIAAKKRRTVILLLAFVGLLWGFAYVMSKAFANPGLLFVIGVFSLLYAVASCHAICARIRIL